MLTLPRPVSADLTRNSKGTRTLVVQQGPTAPDGTQNPGRPYFCPPTPLLSRHELTGMRPRPCRPAWGPSGRVASCCALHRREQGWFVRLFCSQTLQQLTRPALSSLPHSPAARPAALQAPAPSDVDGSPIVALPAGPGCQWPCRAGPRAVAVAFSDFGVAACLPWRGSCSLWPW